ncbi:MAG TPA: sulfite exporter TauE/SafE family protein [Solirubrobacteraceae bacterium]|nr:sulfite exporter TauE/SafE family protein [Solirubrobacteraceae bacterium]
MIVEAALIGVVAGAVSGMLGVGGGILFVPALVLVLGLSQVDGEATSLLAILPVAVVGTWRQQRYGNVRLAEGLLMGALAAAGTVGGVALVNVLPAHVTKIAFAVLLLFTALQMTRRALAPDADPEPREAGS